MFSILRRNPLAVVLAVLMHVVLLAFMVVGVDWLEKPQPVATQVEVVNARVVDDAKLQAEIEKLKKQREDREQAKAQAQRDEEQRLEELKQRREDEKRKLAEIEQQRKAREQAAEAERKAAEKKRQQEEAARKQAEEQRKKAEAERRREEAERKRAEEELQRQEAERKKAEAERKRQEEEARQKAEAERQRKEEEARQKAEAERQRKEAEARRKAEAERQRKAAEARARAERERLLAEQLQAEQDASERAQAVAAIKAKIERNWLRPPGTAELGLTCKIRVRLGPSGSVLAASLVDGSGHGAFDRSVIKAVEKADPLPMPRSPRLVDQFRDLTFVFDPSK